MENFTTASELGGSASTRSQHSARANAFYAGLCLVSAYMRGSANDMLRGVISPSEQEEADYALYLKSLGWVASLEKLNTPGDFQAIAAGTRALLETTVDAVLLCHDPKGEFPQRMLDWSDACKFKMCNEVIAWHQTRGRALPEEHLSLKDFYDRHVQLVKVKQQKHGWSKRTPDRWTDRTLDKDCVEADRLEGAAIREEMGMTLEEFYLFHVRRLNWNLHGSGVTNVNRISFETICGQCALAFKYSGDLALLSTKLALRQYGFGKAHPNIDVDWASLKQRRLDLALAGGVTL